MTFESKVCDSPLEGSFLPSFSNSSLNLASSAAYHTRKAGKHGQKSYLVIFSNISQFS